MLVQLVIISVMNAAISIIDVPSEGCLIESTHFILVISLTVTLWTSGAQFDKILIILYR